MKPILDTWKAFLSEARPINEMWHLESPYIPEEFIDGLPSAVQDKIKEIEALDFAFERYPKVASLKDKVIHPVPIKFFVPFIDKAGARKEQFFDFSNDDDPDSHIYARAPTEEELRGRGTTIPILPDKWYNAFLLRVGAPLLEKKKPNRDLSQVKTLAVFDFDDTLFRSTDVKKRIGVESPLSPESLPEKPLDSDWNLDMVYKAQEMCSNPSVYCVMMTGKIGNIFEDKVNKLLQDKRIFFADTLFNEFGGDTAEFKIKEIYNIISMLPNAQQLIMWDDQEEKLEKYTEEFSDKILFKPRLVGEEDDQD